MASARPWRTNIAASKVQRLRISTRAIAREIPALLGIHAAGAVYLPIGLDQPEDRAVRILQSSDVHSVLWCGARTPQADGLPVPAITVAEAIAHGRAEIPCSLQERLEQEATAALGEVQGATQAA